MMPGFMSSMSPGLGPRSGGYRGDDDSIYDCDDDHRTTCLKCSLNDNGKCKCRQRKATCPAVVQKEVHQ